VLTKHSARATPATKCDLSQASQISWAPSTPVSHTGCAYDPVVGTGPGGRAGVLPFDHPSEPLGRVCHQTTMTVGLERSSALLAGVSGQKDLYERSIRSRREGYRYPLVNREWLA